MKANRSRIIIEYKDNGYKVLLDNKKDIDIYYESDKKNIALIFCNKEDEKYLFETLKNDPSITNCYISNERINSYNF